jgi:hypothetical protein
MTKTAICRFCGDEVEAVSFDDSPVYSEPYPLKPGNKVPNPHSFYASPSGPALLHHVCTSRTAGIEWDWAQDWWACHEPGRPLDEHAHFELHCPDCARRWGDANLTPSDISQPS